MITASSLVANVTGKLKINNNAVDVARFQIYAALNAAVKHLLNVLPPDQINNSIKHTRADLTVGVSEYQWPNDFVKFVALRVKFTSAGAYVPTKVAANFEDNQNYFNQPRTIFPQVDLAVERGFRIRPTPSASVTDGIDLKYVYLFPDISAVQNCLLDEKWRNAVEYYATAYAASVEGYKPELYAHFMGLFDREIAPYLPEK